MFCFGEKEIKMIGFDWLYNKLLMAYYKVETGAGLTCIGRLVIQGHGSYKFGNNVVINSKESVNPIGGNKTVLQTINGGKIYIGDNVGMSHAVLSSRAEIRIEDHVLIGGGVKIFDHDFHAIQYEQRIEEEDTYVKSKPILIQEGAFIGAHSIILKGVTIGKHSVIGAGSVVTRDVPDNEIWGGNPARYIKQIKTARLLLRR